MVFSWGLNHLAVNYEYMKILLDTHAIIWFIDGNISLPKKYRELIADMDNEIHISCISLFEMAIKIKLEKLALNSSLDEFIKKVISEEIKILPLTNSHITFYNQIPFFNNHRDPFDRMIISTSAVESMPIISFDKQFSNYSDIINVIY